MPVPLSFAHLPWGTVTASAFSVQGPEDMCGKRAKDSARDAAGDSMRDSASGLAGNSVGTRCREDESSRWNGAGGTCLQRTTIGRRLRKVDYDCLPKYPPALPSLAR